MPLTLLHGPAGAHKSDFLIKQILDAHLTRGSPSDFVVLLPHATALEAHQKKLMSSLDSQSVLMGETHQTSDQFLFKLLKLNLPRLHRASSRVSRLVLRNLLFTQNYPAFDRSRYFGSFIQEILDSILQLKQNGLDPSSFRKMLKDEASETLSDFLQLFQNYNDKLGENHYADEGDCVLWTLRLLRERRMLLPPGLKSIFVDRFFPITLGQREIVKELANSFPDLEIILSYSFDYQTADDPYLYPAYTFLGELADRYDYFHLTQSPPTTELYRFADPASELEGIVDRIGEELSKGISPDQIGICVPPYSFYHQRLTQLMIQRNIPITPPFLNSLLQYDHLGPDSMTSTLALFHKDQSNRSLLAESLTSYAAKDEFEKEWEFEINLWLGDFTDKGLLDQWKKEEKNFPPLSSPHLNSGGVSVFGLDRSEGFEGEVLFLAGFTDRFYPSPVRAHLFYTPEMLASAELREILAGPVYRSSVEKHRLIHLVQRTKNRVVVTRPQILWDGKEQSLSRLAPVLLGAGPVSPSSPGSPHFVAVWRGAPSGEPPAPHEHMHQRAVFPKTRKNRFSISELTTYQKCPYQYYARYHLKLGELKEETFEAPPDVIGSLIHRTLQRLYSENSALYQEAVEYDLYRKRLQEKACQTVKEEINRDPFFVKAPLPVRESFQTRVGSTFSLFLEMEIGFLREKKKQTYPHLFEWAFGNKKVSPLRIPAPHNDILVSGRIDRIDINETLKTFTVIDYKSGSVDSSKQIREGLSLQIPLYMMAVEEQGLKGYRPAGGWLISFGDLSKKSGIFLQAGGDDELFGKNYRITENEWDELKKIVRQKIVEISASINEGEFNPKPKEPSLCWTCDYRAICHYQKGTNDG